MTYKKCDIGGNPFDVGFVSRWTKDDFDYNLKKDSVAPTEPDEAIKRLIKGCIKGDRRSQKELYRSYYALSIKICLRYADSRDDALGIMNEGFYKVFANIRKYDFERPFITWLARIMTNTAIDFYRANLRFANSMSNIDENENIGSSDESIHSRLHYDDLLAMIQSLSPAYRTVFNLYAIEGYSHEEIAGILNISVGTSKSNLFKARAKLTEMVRISEISGSTKKMNLEE